MHPLLSGWYLGERLREAAAPPALVSIGGFFSSSHGFSEREWV